MRSLVLTDLPSDVRRSIRRRAYRERTSFEKAAIDLLSESCAIDHDIEIMRRRWDYEDDDAPAF